MLGSISVCSFGVVFLFCFFFRSLWALRLTCPQLRPWAVAQWPVWTINPTALLVRTHPRGVRAPSLPCSALLHHLHFSPGKARSPHKPLSRAPQCPQPSPGAIRRPPRGLIPQERRQRGDLPLPIASTCMFSNSRVVYAGSNAAL